MRQRTSQRLWCIFCHISQEVLLFKFLYPYVICEQTTLLFTWACLYGISRGRAGVVVCIFFFLIKSEQKSLFLQHWELWETRRCVAAVVSWKRHNDHVSKVLMLMGWLLTSKSRSMEKFLLHGRPEVMQNKWKHLKGQLRIILQTIKGAVDWATSPIPSKICFTWKILHLE